MENKKHLEEIKEFEEAKKAQVMAKNIGKNLSAYYQKVGYRKEP